MSRESIRFLGARHSEATSNVPAHMHEYYELNFMTNGSTRMKLNEKVIEYDSYDFLLIPPHTKHILDESDHEQFHNYIIWFELREEKMILENQIIKLHDYEGVVQFLCAAIYQNYMKSGLADEEVLNIYLEAVLWHMKKGLRLATDQSAGSSQDLIDVAIKHINVNVKDPNLSVSWISRKLNVSEEHFSRMFKKKIGMPPVKYINEVKIAEAKRMLLKTNLPVKEIAYQLNYSDQFYFSQKFKKITGYSPTEFRKNPMLIQYYNTFQ
jgi:AraC-like DNA-binding protein